MKKRIVSFLLLFALLITAVPLQAEASGSRLPIYIGYVEVDYMAEEILKEIPTEGLSTRDQIQAVYDWIIDHCAREGDDSKTYFDEEEVARLAQGAYLDSLKEKEANHQLIIRSDLNADTTVSNTPTEFVAYDSNEYIANCAYEMMLHRVGNCGHFSALLSVLLGHLGYDCRLIYGEFISLDGTSAKHVWNYVLVDGTYLWADIRIDHAVKQQTGAPSHTYFLVEDTEAWAREHTWDHTYSDWLKENEKEIAKELQLDAEAANGPWGACSAWAKDYMTKAGEAGLIPARLDYQDLTMNITRAEFAAVAVNLYEALQQPVEAFKGETPFSDTNDPDVLRAYSLGVVEGMGDGTFAPDSNLTREQAVTMLGRVYELAETNAISGGSSLPQGSLSFSDGASISEYARQYVYFFVGEAIVDGMGDGTFAPKASMTREQAIKISGETAAKFS